jgi:signal peptidase I
VKTLGRITFWVVLIGGIVSLILYLTVLEPWTIPNTDATFVAALQPNLFADDVLLLSRRNDAQVGWMVRCADPDAPGYFVVGRVMARAGSTVDSQNAVVRIDNHTFPAPTRCDPPKMTVRNPASQEDTELDCSDEEIGGMAHHILRGPTAEKDTHVVVESNNVFLASDNRSIHMDSRDFGQIPANSCQHILFRLWSADDKGRFSLVW